MLPMHQGGFQKTYITKPSEQVAAPDFTQMLSWLEVAQFPKKRNCEPRFPVDQAPYSRGTIPPKRNCELVFLRNRATSNPDSLTRIAGQSGDQVWVGGQSPDRLRVGQDVVEDLGVAGDLVDEVGVAGDLTDDVGVAGQLVDELGVAGWQFDRMKN